MTIVCSKLPDHVIKFSAWKMSESNMPGKAICTSSSPCSFSADWAINKQDLFETCVLMVTRFPSVQVHKLSQGHLPH
jgi:hypothetical protein